MQSIFFNIGVLVCSLHLEFHISFLNLVDLNFSVLPCSSVHLCVCSIGLKVCCLEPHKQAARHFGWTQLSHSSTSEAREFFGESQNVIAPNISL